MHDLSRTRHLLSLTALGLSGAELSTLVYCLYSGQPLDDPLRYLFTAVWSTPWLIGIAVLMTRHSA